MTHLCDSHTHSHHSIDSSASIQNMCQGAIVKGFAAFAITEHYDLNPRDEGYNFFKFEPFDREFRETGEKFHDRVKLLKGVEFSEPHNYPDVLDELQKQDYDVIVGSIHWVGESFAGSRSAFRAYKTPNTFYEHYYREMLDAIRCGGFDILAHFDFPKCYLKTTLTDLSIVDEVLAALAESQIALEINTSSLRKGYPESMPDQTILGKYAQAGGIRITLGSDAHTPEDIGADFAYALRLIERFPQFQIGYFEQRRFISIDRPISDAA